jgi:hypothetical protein
MYVALGVFYNNYAESLELGNPGLHDSIIFGGSIDGTGSAFVNGAVVSLLASSGTNILIDSLAMVKGNPHGVVVWQGNCTLRRCTVDLQDIHGYGAGIAYNIKPQAVTDGSVLECSCTAVNAANYATVSCVVGKRRGLVTFAEVEVPSVAADRRGLVTWTEFELPLSVLRRAIISFTELEVPDAAAQARIGWTEMELPDPVGPAATQFQASSWITCLG